MNTHLPMERGTPSLQPKHLVSMMEQYSDSCRKRIAFVAIQLSGTLGVAVESECGFYQIPPYWYHNSDTEALTRYANKLNSDVLGLSVDEATAIIASTMKTTRNAIPELNDIAAVTAQISRKQIEELDAGFSLFSKLATFDEFILDATSMSQECLNNVARTLLVDPEEFAGKYMVLSVTD